MAHGRAGDLEPVVEEILANYSRVEPRPAAMRAWLARRAEPLPRAHFLRLPAPAWAAIALALMLILGVTWYRGNRAQTHTAPTLANEHTVVEPIKANDAAPLTDEQKQLIQLLQSDPAALATKQPAETQPPKKEKHP